MNAVSLCLLVFCVGLCHSIPHTWLHDGYPQQGSQPRHVRQSDAPTICDECSSFSTGLNLFEAQCITPGLIQGLVDSFTQCGNNFNALATAHLCAQKEDNTFCRLVNSSSFFGVDANCDSVESTSSCSPQCKSSLEALRNDFGCCINSIINITSINEPLIYSSSFWSMCGVETVGLCSNIATITPVNFTTNCPSQREQSEMLQDSVCANGQFTVDRFYEGDVCRKTLASDFVDSCGQNDFGRYCGTDRSLLDNITLSCTQGNETCSPECRDALLAARSEIDCCVNNLFNMTFDTSSSTCQPFPDTIFDLWDRCNVVSPGFCPSTLTHTSVMTTSVVMTTTDPVMTTSGCEFLTALTFLSVAMALVSLALTD